MSTSPETRPNGITAAKIVVAVVCALLAGAGMLHDAQHAASDAIESCAACPQLGHAAPTTLVKLELPVDYDEIRIAPQPASEAPTPAPFGPRLTRAPPLS